ncbi:hypothetical protein C9439_04460, partial [archaeon SCG-AAA382B04]
KLTPIHPLPKIRDLRKGNFSANKLKNIKILGFSYLIHLLEKGNYLKKDIWDVFYEIIRKNNWKRSEVYVANYTFLKEMNY